MRRFFNAETPRILASFRQHFSGIPLLVRSPGRVNLIGEHTDYNDGFVLPATIDKSIILAVAPRPDRACRFFAADLNEAYESSLDKLKPSGRRWPNYLLGVPAQLISRGPTLAGVDCAFGGNLPMDSGMSSSAALEAGFAFALNQLFELGLSRLQLSQLAQRAESEFVGVRCGIMDQFANLLGRERAVMKLDCRSLEVEYFAFDRDDVCVVLCDTGLRRKLAASQYNIRREQCEAGMKILQQYDPNIRALRDVTVDRLEARRAQFDPTVYRRCLYVIRENARVLEACDDLVRGDFAAFGHRMTESHQGLRDDYEVSCRELDILVEEAEKLPGVFGSRMMGAGFAGCTINLVEDKHLETFLSTISRRYAERSGRETAIHVCRIEAGTSVIEME